MNKIHYNPILKDLARHLRNNSTKSEIKLWAYLKNKQFMGYDFHRQKPIDDFIVDFFCNKLMLAIELDGYTHTFGEIHAKDQKKDERLYELGIKVLRFSDDDIMNNIENALWIIGNFVKHFEIAKHPHTPLSPLFRGEIE